MKIIVAVKRVIDPYVKIRVKPDGLGVDVQQVKMSMNPFDEIAVEEALRMREAGHAMEVVLVTIGQDVCQDVLRHGLALGADRAILVRTHEMMCSLNLAHILKNIVLDEKPGLVLMGKQSIDGDNNQTPQMLAGLLDWPQATYASKLTFDADGLRVFREIDGGIETLQLQLPAVVSTDLRLNEPRYASLPNIMKAKNKPLVIKDLNSMDLNLKPHVEIMAVNAPVIRTGGVRVESVQALIDKLKHEAKVI
jgi:electron transfer flavoprotein beta subunit